jgi:ferredoxin
MHITLSSDTCQGHGRCYTLAPELFDCDDDGYAVLVRAGEVPAELADGARLAAANCPEDAITLGP